MNETIRTYNVIIADDNEIDRLSTQMYVKQFPFLNITGVYDSAEDVLEAVNDDIGLLLLDIDMPGMSGHDLRRKLGNQQVCIFITSFPDYAVDSFELEALDFIVKPINKPRFTIAMERFRDYMETREKAELFTASLGGDVVFIKDGHNQIKLQLHEIVYLEALKDYTRIVTRDNKYCVLSVLGNLLKENAFGSFIRIHRSYAVQRHFINKLSAQEVYLDNITLPVGRSYKAALEQAITGN